MNTPTYGTFKTMNLHKRLLRNIRHTVTTPIQRKVIPLIRSSKNITGIARTGSGKTFAYLVPIIDNILKQKKDGNDYDQNGPPNFATNDISFFDSLDENFKNLSNTVNSANLSSNTSFNVKNGSSVNDNSKRYNFDCLILVPTRELALQVAKVTNSLIHKTGLTSVVFHGGASIFRDFNKLVKGETDNKLKKSGKNKNDKKENAENSDDEDFLNVKMDCDKFGDQKNTKISAESISSAGVNGNICISTIGRLLHILRETKKTLNTQYLVVDELDRIFDDPKMSLDLDILLSNDVSDDYIKENYQKKIN
ncbi:hypothetical protein EDEG_02962 [Edhazardia aedis USNM 41457]|uniref:ATP-dependent RNA helicase n=1 Tax=Edhazardia aedis (strain USNM 41457) TaxID=1003232 RepID=J9DMS5_EDHAE|nr:hypothetical protein EDEG_02962 [Edhazardia aedis USNM 41457]|eukprot:EJW02642.1 hypothetical protein EDEG_02962 [Edhazardia aedis USNM 41457]